MRLECSESQLITDLSFIGIRIQPLLVYHKYKQAARLRKISAHIALSIWWEYEQDRNTDVDIPSPASLLRI